MCLLTAFTMLKWIAGAIIFYTQVVTNTYCFNDYFLYFKITSPVRYKGEIVAVLTFLFKMSKFWKLWHIINLCYIRSLPVLTFHLFKWTKGQPYPLGVSLFCSRGNTIYIESCMAYWILGWNTIKGEFLKCQLSPVTLCHCCHNIFCWMRTFV